MTKPILKRGVEILLFLVFFILLVGGCSGEGAQELFDTAQFEERQNNQSHARELYQQIVTKFPNSEFAKKAQARLAELQQTP